MNGGLAMALAGAVLFSAKAIIIKLAYRHGVDAVTLLMLRMAFALPFFLAMAWWGGRGRAPLDARDRWAVLGLGVSGYYLASFLDFLGLQFISASLERLILYLNPTLVMGVAWLWLKRPITLRQLGALGLSYAGIVVVFGHELHWQGPSAALGSALVFGSALLYAVYLVASGQHVQRLGALRLTGLATSVACVLCIVQWALLRPVGGLAELPAPVWWLSVLNATACTAAPVLMVMVAVQRVGPTLAAQAGMIGPVSTVALGVLILGEPFTPTIALGTALVMGGVWWLARLR